MAATLNNFNSPAQGYDANKTVQLRIARTLPQDKDAGGTLEELAFCHSVSSSEFEDPGTFKLVKFMKHARATRCESNSGSIAT